MGWLSRLPQARRAPSAGGSTGRGRRSHDPRSRGIAAPELSRLAWVIAAAICLLSVSPAVAAGKRDAASPPTGDSRGVALLLAVEKAYRNVDGVQVEVPKLELTGTIVLRSGAVVAETLVSSDPSGRSTFVLQLGATTYERAPGKKCWDPQPGFVESAMGFPFPTGFRNRVAAPQPTAAGWKLQLVTEDRDGSRATSDLVIDRKTDLIRSMVARSGGAEAVESVRALPVRPAMPSTHPRC